MSYDVSITTDPDVEVYDSNYTSNTSPMWKHALGRSLREFDGTPASEATGALIVGVARMKADPEFYKQWNPPNNWGNYEGAMDFLLRLTAACAQHPSGTIRVRA